MPVVRTADIGLDSAGNVEVYVPPNVTVIPEGATVTYGTATTYPDGTTIPLAGAFFFVSGTVIADGPVRIATISVINGPPVPT